MPDSRTLLHLLAALAVAASGGGATGCAGGEGRALQPLGGRGAGSAASRPYIPDRRDYAAFREANPDRLLEPNYLPFMVHRFSLDEVQGDALVLCRYQAEQMPIRVFVVAPTLGPDVQDEWNPVPAERYVRSAERALAVWEGELEGLVDFEPAPSIDRADLVLRLIGERAPELSPGRQTLGRAEALDDACVARGWDDDAERLDVRFEMPEVALYVVDESGPLPPRFVFRVALHELGHALGMRGHSPSPGDVMHPILADRSGPDELSIQDVNSFVSLYRVESGAHFVNVGAGEPAPRPPPAPPSGAPVLALAPHVDARRGFEIHLPAGWLKIEEPNGIFAANGPSWDHDASIRVFIWPSPAIEDFLACCAGQMLAGSFMRRRGETALAGRRTLWMEVEDASGSLAQTYRFAEIPGDRVMMLVSESPAGHHRAWQPWFQESIGSLRLWDADGDPKALGARADEDR